MFYVRIPRRLCQTLLTGIGWVAAVLSAPAAPTPATYPQGSAFPLEVYEVDAGDVPALARHGWNIFQSYQNRDPKHYDDYLTSLAADQAAGLAAIPYTGTSTNKFEWPRPRVQAWVRTLARNQNVAWWDLPEEARPWSGRELKILQDYTLSTRANDPLHRPTYEYTPNNRNADNISHIAPHVDILGISCYCEEIRMPHAWVRYKIEESGLHGIQLAGDTVGPDYLHHQKTPVAIIYCAKDPNTQLMPTPDQTYHDFWSAIVSGAQGIGVYAYHHALADDPTLTRNLERLNEAASEISGPEKLGEVILSGTPDPNVNCHVISGPQETVAFRPPTETKNFQYPSLHILSKIKDGAIYILAVNSTDQPLTANLTGLPPAAARLSLPFENRSLNLKSGGATDTFGPWGVHIYKLTNESLSATARR